MVYATLAFSENGSLAASDWYSAYQYGAGAQYYAYLDYSATGGIYSIDLANDCFSGHWLAYSNAAWIGSNP
jgi:hypothetical protein